MEAKYIRDDQVGTSTCECCPECGYEIEIDIHKLKDCPYCGYKEVLPCSVCVACQGNDHESVSCDWNEETRCTPFPRK